MKQNCKYTVDHVGFNNEIMYKPSCSSNLTVPMLGDYCPICGNKILINKAFVTQTNHVRKYYMNICNCGKIHMIPINKITEAQNIDKDIILICADCGNATTIGADIDIVVNEYSIPCFEHDNKEFTLADFNNTAVSKGIHKIIYNHGIKVPMNTGEYANHSYNGNFADMIYPDFYKIQRKDVTAEEVMEFINTYHKNRTTVDMDRFIHENSDEILEELSHYAIEGFNYWKGTKYEKEWK